MSLDGVLYCKLAVFVRVDFGCGEEAAVGASRPGFYNQGKFEGEDIASVGFSE